jgi:phosphatidylglycerophosphatase A
MNAITELIAGIFGGWETVLLLAVILVLYGSRTNLGKGLHRGMREFRRTLDEVTEELRNPEVRSKESRFATDSLILWLAQGFDLGRIPVAPGTFGSLAGLLWTAILIVPDSLTIYCAGLVLGLAASVFICGEAERILGEKDPPSVVLDEIAALPVCFLPWVVAETIRQQGMPPVDYFVGARTAWVTVVLFALFRVFDVAKPWPIRQSQALPGGWGVTVDDVLAALWVAGLSLLWVL